MNSQVRGRDSSTAPPSPIQAMRQPAASIRYTARGTITRPPSDSAVELMPMTVPLILTNHRDSSAEVLVRDNPLCATEARTPNTNTKNRKLKVQYRDMVTSPSANTEPRMSFRPPVRSKS